MCFYISTSLFSLLLYVMNFVRYCFLDDLAINIVLKWDTSWIWLFMGYQLLPNFGNKVNNVELIYLNWMFDISQTMFVFNWDLFQKWSKCFNQQDTWEIDGLVSSLRCGLVDCNLKFKSEQQGARMKQNALETRMQMLARWPVNLQRNSRTHTRSQQPQHEKWCEPSEDLQWQFRVCLEMVSRRSRHSAHSHRNT